MTAAAAPGTILPDDEGLGIIGRLHSGRAIYHTFKGVGQRGYFALDIIKALSEPRTYGPEVVKQLKAIGVDSIPLVLMVSAFIGGVISLQSRYQLFPGIQLSVVGFITRQSLILELGPLLTGLVLAGRVGAQMTAEIGTMRVTEQIDALETLAYDPIAYLVVPRIIAGFVMVTALTVFANAIGIGTAYLTAVLATDIKWFDFRDGLRLGVNEFQIFYSLLKAFLFGGAIAFLCSYEGYVTSAGAEGVGRSTAKAVVITSVWILVLDALIASALAPYLQT